MHTQAEDDRQTYGEIFAGEETKGLGQIVGCLRSKGFEQGKI